MQPLAFLRCIIYLILALATHLALVPGCAPKLFLSIPRPLQIRFLVASSFLGRLLVGCHQLVGVSSTVVDGV